MKCWIKKWISDEKLKYYNATPPRICDLQRSERFRNLPLILSSRTDKGESQEAVWRRIRLGRSDKVAQDDGISLTEAELRRQKT